ncbi:MAG: hypothetical protein H6917_00890 [Novosphingobium sp.]|nr:hypothetical protein [Novosphingobium sp.]MCP5400925.1 hypothetical protein [Novosphingobium sp.]
MQKFLATLATGALLASAAIPAAALAQDGVAVTQIVVTGKHKKQWDKGSALERKGLDARAKAQKQLAEANRDVIDAQTKRDTNQDKAENASGDFRQLTAVMPVFTSGTEAARWARQVDQAASRWAKSDSRSVEGAKDLRSAMKAQSKAQEAVDKAQAQIDQGQSLMAEAERRSMVATSKN